MRRHLSANLVGLEKLSMSSDSAGWTQVMYDAGGHSCGETSSSGELKDALDGPIIAQRRNVRISSRNFKNASREDNFFSEAPPEKIHHKKHQITFPAFAKEAVYKLNSVENGFRTLDRILDELRGRLAGRDKEEVMKALTTAEALEIMCTHAEPEQLNQQEKFNQQETGQVSTH